MATEPGVVDPVAVIAGAGAVVAGAAVDPVLGFAALMVCWAWAVRQPGVRRHAGPVVQALALVAGALVGLLIAGVGLSVAALVGRDAALGVVLLALPLPGIAAAALGDWVRERGRPDSLEQTFVAGVSWGLTGFYVPIGLVIVLALVLAVAR